MCSSFSKIFPSLEMWISISRNNYMKGSRKDVYDFYGIENSFDIYEINQLDWSFIANINETLWSNFRNIFFSVFVISRLLKFYKKPDDIIIYTRVWHLVLFLGLLNRLRVVKYKVYFEAHKYSSRLKIIYSLCDGVIAINKLLKEKISLTSKKNILVAHDGVNIKDYQSISNYLFRRKISNVNILYTGSFAVWKGVYTLIDALKFLPKKYKLTCIGGYGVEKESLMDYIMLNNLNDRVRVIGHVERKKLLSFVECADVFVLPNLNIGEFSQYTSPIKLFEYMASKRPIVASNINAIKEIVDYKSSIFFKSGDPESLAKSIEYASLNDCSAMVRNAFQLVKKYEWDGRASNIKDFILKGKK